MTIRFRVLHWFVTFALFILFLTTFIISLKKILSRKTGTTLKIEYEPKLPDFTICPWDYNHKFIKTITSQSGHNVSDVTRLLPSIKDLITSIIKGDVILKNNTQR